MATLGICFYNISFEKIITQAQRFSQEVNCGYNSHCLSHASTENHLYTDVLNSPSLKLPYVAKDKHFVVVLI